jgi:hypothetical protein
MFSPADIVKHGAPGLVGFLLGLVAIAVIEPRTTDGKVLLLGTTVVLTVLIYLLGKWIVARLTAGGGAKGDTPDE